jgi:hypothetical protein
MMMQTKLEWLTNNNPVLHFDDSVFGDYIVNRIKIDTVTWKSSAPYGDTSPIAHRKPIYRMEDSVIDWWKDLILKHYQYEKSKTGIFL